jgi:hypothetical protein
MKVNEYLPNLDVEALVWFDALERFYRPWKMVYFRLFSNVISIKMSRAARKEYLQHGGNVMDDVTCKSSIAACLGKCSGKQCLWLAACTWFGVDVFGGVQVLGIRY